jgi:hypothetical protein
MRLSVSISILFLLSAGSIIKTSAQEQKHHQMRKYYAPDGTLYWNKKLSVYVWISSSPDELPKKMESKQDSQYVDPYFFDTEGTNFIQTRWAVDKKTMLAVVPEHEVRWPVEVDGIKPISSAEIAGEKPYSKNSKKFYGNISIKISAKDNLSGVDTIYYSLDGKPYEPYTSAISNLPDGEHNLLYYAVDKVGNFEVPRKETFNIDTKSPKTYYTITGISLENNVISSNTKIILQAEDENTGIKATYYKFDAGKEIIYNGRNLPTENLANGDHTLTFYSVDNVGNRENPVTFQFNLDKMSPIITSDVLGDRYVVGDQTYFSGRTKLKLTAVDNKSGIKETMYSVDGGKFQNYTEPFYLPSVIGLHIIKYFAVDNAGNNTEGTNNAIYEEYKHRVERIYVDMTGPSITCSYQGPVFTSRDTVFISGKTKIKLTAFDKESGLNYISYSIDGVIDETKYKEPFSINLSGLHKLEFFAYDNVNNRNAGSIVFFEDNEGPVPNCQFSIKPVGVKDGFEVYPDYVLAYLSATDQTTGTTEIFYSINGQPEKKFSTYVGNFPKGQKINLKMRAVDKLGNENQKEFIFYIQ